MVQVYWPADGRAAPVVVFSADHPEELDLLPEFFGSWDATPNGFWIEARTPGSAPARVAIVGAGLAPVSELRDLALAQIQNLRERVARGEGVVPFARYRAEQGLPPASEFDARFREAVEDRIKRHRRNPVTDPARDPTKPTRPPQFVVPAKRWAKES